MSQVAFTLKFVQKGIMDLDQKVEEGKILPPEETISKPADHGKCCVDCSTTKTPLWRSGPAGPKSLCNACGIRFRKKRAAASGKIPATENLDKKEEPIKNGKEVVEEECLDKAEEPIKNGKEVVEEECLDKEEEQIKNGKEGGEKETSVKKKKKKDVKIRDAKCGKLSVKWKQRFMAFGQEVVLYQRQRSPILRKRHRIHKNLGEVEQAALLLMALSGGSVFA